MISMIALSDQGKDRPHRVCMELMAARSLSRCRKSSQMDNSIDTFIRLFTSSGSFHWIEELNRLTISISDNASMT